MAIDRLVGLQVADEAGYAEYRRRMLPILASFGGSFVVDVRVGEVLLAPGGATFNRMFVLRFPDEAAMTAFFANPGYREVRAAHFEPSVSSSTPLGRYHVLG